jgi:ATPase subunit of ABC transporter with duplicated ATPase domains
VADRAGERTGILGVNGAGKSTLLGLVSGDVAPTAGRVKRGKTVKVATLTQRLDELEDHLDDPVRVVIERLRTTYTFGSGSKAQELTPGQLLERMGFASAQLSTPVKDLSGGQKRRLQLLLILLEQPNVLILDEPTNDLDTDMLAAMEDLLDTWPGTLLVVSHDRYFIERVTDQQYAILGGHLRHLPAAWTSICGCASARGLPRPRRRANRMPRHQRPLRRGFRDPNSVLRRKRSRRWSAGWRSSNRRSPRRVSPWQTTTSPTTSDSAPR